MPYLSLIGALLGLLASPVQAPPAGDTALHALAEAERRFAAAAKAKGIRDAFLEFFSDDAIALIPDPVPAKPRLTARPSQPFSVHELVWEPRAGGLAASGEMGWLTGPSTFVDHATANAAPRYGNYLSVWKREAGGSWRVYIDIGIDTPGPVPFEPGFTRIDLPARFLAAAGVPCQEAATAALLGADRALNAAIDASGLAAAYGSALAGRARLHRGGAMPASSRTAILEWLRRQPSGWRAVTGAGGAARSCDLGYTYGRYERDGAAGERGPYLRVWSRDAAGSWRLVADVAHPVRVP